MRKIILTILVASLILTMVSLPLSVGVNAEQQIRIEVRREGQVVRVELWEATNEQLSELVASGEIPHDVTHLLLGYNQLSDISPISKFTNLEVLSLSNNQIVDITPLETLINLRSLSLYENQIVDISVLRKLTNLGGDYSLLDLGDNQITDISPLSNLTNLQWLDLSNNQITDLTPLENLVNLTFYTLKGNPVTDEQIADLKSKMKIYASFVDRVLGKEPVTIDDALEILKYLAKLDSVITDGNVAFYAARITGGDTPTIDDALEILKKLAKLESVLDSVLG